MRYWTIVFIGLAVVAAILPLTGATETAIGDGQIVVALALVALLARFVWAAAAPDQVPEIRPASPPPPPEDVPPPD
jgi:uncharacterized membrane protein YtjA (UPF0391 family)